MSFKVCRNIVDNYLPALRNWKDCQAFKISEGSGSDVVLFNGKSAKLMTNQVFSLEGEKINLAESKAPGKTISQKFTMTWVTSENLTDKEIEFRGLTGGLKGQLGRPGVRFDPCNSTVYVNLLLCRSQGTFGIYSTNGETLYMVVAPPNEENGPDHEKITVVPFTDGVRLGCGWWHSVPFPHPQGNSLELEEFVVESVENEVLDLTKETGKTLKLTF